MKARSLISSVFFATTFLLNAFAFGQDYEFAAGDVGLADIEAMAKERYIVKFRDPKIGEAPIVVGPDREKNLRNPAPFGKHSTGQDIGELERRFNLNGEILTILDSTNSIYVKMPEEEAERLRKHPDVLRVTQDSVLTLDATQNSPGNALDRMDESAPATPDGTYNYTYTGAGVTIYFLDSGLDVGQSYITAEFGSRASVIHDFNSGGTGQDCIASIDGHGTAVASIAAGNTYGVAKGATVVMAKVTFDCDFTLLAGAVATSLNWLAANAAPGSIANLSLGIYDIICNTHSQPDIFDGIIDATDAGVLVITSAGNSNCDVATIDWKNMPEAFVVGALIDPAIDPLIPDNQDRRWIGSNYGQNVSTWAPGENVWGLLDDYTGGAVYGRTGTSYSTPLVSGMAAVACDASATNECQNNSVLDLYAAFRNTGTMNTVLNPNGTTMTNSPSRMIWQQW